jgi:multiple sugar transport system permease protein
MSTMNTPVRQTRSLRPRLGALWTYLLAISYSLLILVPVYWLVRSAFSTASQLNKVPPIWLPAPTLQNFTTLITQVPFFAYLSNSFWFSVGTTLASLAVSFLAAYAFARLEIPGSAVLLWVLTLSMALPDVGTIVPLYRILAGLHLLDTIAGLILVLSSTLAPFTVWVLVSFIKQVPYEIEEAARIDGASLAQIMWRVLLPVSMPGLVTMGLINFINAWNNLLYPLSFSTSKAAKTLSVSITEVFAGYSPWGKPWELIMAVGVVMVAPVVVLVLLSQRSIVSGLTRGAIK